MCKWDNLNSNFFNLRRKTYTHICIYIFFVAEESLSGEIEKMKKKITELEVKQNGLE